MRSNISQGKLHAPINSTNTFVFKSHYSPGYLFFNRLRFVGPSYSENSLLRRHLYHAARNIGESNERGSDCDTTDAGRKDPLIR